MPDFRNFECDNCGACCRKLIVEATYQDAQREPRLYQIAGPNLEHEKFRVGDQCIKLYDNDKKGCHFLTSENKCGIYPTRPHECVGVEPGDAKCQQARELEGLPMLCDRDGKAPTEKMLMESADEYWMDFVPYFGSDVECDE